MNRSEAINAITIERMRQDALKAAGRFPHTLNDPALSNADRLCKLAEELGEIARCVNDHEERGRLDVEALRTELTQLGALALSWLEADEIPAAKPRTVAVGEAVQP